MISINNGFTQRKYEIKGHPAVFRRNIAIYTEKLHRCALCGCLFQNCPCLDAGVTNIPGMPHEFDGMSECYNG
jgi:hypothetical protein